MTIVNKSFQQVVSGSILDLRLLERIMRECYVDATASASAIVVGYDQTVYIFAECTHLCSDSLFVRPSSVAPVNSLPVNVRKVATAEQIMSPCRKELLP